jgi:hypothetical protein
MSLLAVAIKAPLSMVDDPREVIESAIQSAPGAAERFPGSPLAVDAAVDAPNAPSLSVRPRSLPPR